MADQRSVEAQVLSGLSLTAKVLLVFFTATCIIVGLESLLHPNQGNRSGIAGSHPLIVGVTLLAVGLAILLLTITRWTAILPGILAYAILGGLIEIATGHAINNSAIPVPRWISASLTVYLVAATLLSLSFQNRRLHLFDHIALPVFVLCVLATMVETAPVKLFSLLGVGFTFLLVAWILERCNDNADAFR